MSNTYKVLIEGTNFLMSSGSQEKLVGFFSTFLVKTNNLETVNQDLKPLVLFRIRENHLKIRSGLFSSSRMIIEAIYLEEAEDCDSEAEGFTFYEMSIVSGIFCFVKAAYIKIFFPERVVESN